MQPGSQPTEKIPNPDIEPEQPVSQPTAQQKNETTQPSSQIPEVNSSQINRPYTQQQGATHLSGTNLPQKTYHPYRDLNLTDTVPF